MSMPWADVFDMIKLKRLSPFYLRVAKGSDGISCCDAKRNRLGCLYRVPDVFFMEMLSSVLMKVVRV